MASPDTLTCSVCFHAFDVEERRPWDIGCGHSFCEACLRQHPASFRKCPECRTRASNPHVNIAVMRMLDAAAPAAGARPGAANRPATGTQRAAPPLAATLNSGGNSGSAISSTMSLIGRAFRAATQQQGAPAPAAAAGPSSAAPGSGAAAGPPAAAPGTLASLAQQQPHQLLATHQAKIAEWRSAMWLYLTPLMGFLYLLSPLDIIPDFLPLIGWLDDLLVLAYVACSIFRMLRPTAARRNTMRL